VIALGGRSPWSAYGLKPWASSTFGANSHSLTSYKCQSAQVHKQEAGNA
jgi:hypothetical protein